MLHAQQTPVPCEHAAGGEEAAGRKQTDEETNNNSHFVLQLLLCLFVLLVFQHQEAHLSTAYCASTPATPGSPALPPLHIRHAEKKSNSKRCAEKQIQPGGEKLWGELIALFRA